MAERVLFATHNAGKAAELRAMVAPIGLEVVTNADLGLPAPDETEADFLGNARLKARAAVGATGLAALADDSGLEVDALGGAPGVATADWAETGSGRDFSAAMERLHRELVEAGAPEPWRARFRAVMVLLRPDGTERVAEGVVEGRITWPIRGAVGHGFDPCFVPEGETRTFAEMPAGEKNLISHRARALAALRDALTR